MDDVREIQSANFAQFLDKDVRTNPFGENRSAERAYRRAERLVAALFLLTNHVAPSDHLRSEIRSTATSLLGRVLDLRDEMRSSTSPKISEFQATVRRLISQINILVFAGVVSPQNAEIVSASLDELGTFITLSRRTNLSENVRISREELLEVREYRKGHIKDVKDKVFIKDNLSLKDNKETRKKLALNEGVDTLTTSRSRSILEILRGGGQLNIRDIASNLPEHGEKTIQRELVLLIQQGIVKRIGLKRWSRYALAQ